MIEIKHVTKIYSSKGGVQTRALDDVSITFGETGLVFFLGKSGSGKSTLLNISGGLDEPTSGEVIVKGKSSKNFSGSDFDSYRNTFVGFIFQEYNILDEFNVEDNIALALELQGKPKDKEKIKALLKEVDLADYAKRKPNTLSGGQKQRIAIARALIKDPQIIMADEPTGALDSATGKQVFDTLKKLSESRLVIVVSHDREFAEAYGDRIVELEDGKIISDVIKHAVPPKNIDDNMSILNDETMMIKNGSHLSDKNVKDIKKFLSDTEGDIIITRGSKQIALFKKANRITEDGASEAFFNTKDNEVKTREYTAEESQFIRSRLPIRKAIKIGSSGLKLKPLRLFFTIFLSFVAFTLFGLFSTLMTYSPREVAASTFVESGENFISVGKEYQVRSVNSSGSILGQYSKTARFSEEDVDEFAEKFGNQTFGTYQINDINIGNFNKQVNSAYYKKYFHHFTEVKNGTHSIQMARGTYPNATNEIAISTFMLDVLKQTGIILYNEDGNKIDAEGNISATDVTLDIDEFNILGKYLLLNLKDSLGNGTKTFKIVGIFDSGEVPENYQELKEENNGENQDYILQYQFENWYDSSLASLAIVNDDFFEKYGIIYTTGFTWVYEFDFLESNSEINFTFGDDSGLTSFYGAKVYDSKAYFIPEFIGAKKDTLDAKEVIVPASKISEVMERKAIAEHDKLLSDGQSLGDAGSAFDEYEKYRTVLSIANGENYFDPDTNTQITPTKDEITTARATLKEMFQEDYPQGMPIQLAVGERSSEEYKIVGYYFIGDNVNTVEGLYVSSDLYNKLSIQQNMAPSQREETNYVEPEGAKYNNIFVPYDGTMTSFYKLYDICGIEHMNIETDVFYTITSPLYESIESVNNIAEMLSAVFLWVGIVFAIFAALLLFNFISMSISNKRKEIGILRAVGARGTDVFKIFFAESGIIVGICLILSLIGTAVLCSVLNGILRNSVGLIVTIFVFGVPSILLMIVLSLVVAFISTFLPVYFAAKKKPVDSIRAL